MILLREGEERRKKRKKKEEGGGDLLERVVDMQACGHAGSRPAGGNGWREVTVVAILTRSCIQVPAKD